MPHGWLGTDGESVGEVTEGQVGTLARSVSASRKDLHNRPRVP